MALGVELGLEVEDQVGIGGFGQLGGGVVGLEGGEDGVGFVDEIHHIGGVLTRIAAVEAGEGLHRLDAIEAAIHIHAAEQRLVKAGLELVGHQQDLVAAALERLADVALEPGVEGGTALREALGADLGVAHLATESHQGAKGITLVRDVLVDGELPAHGLLARAHHHHRLGLAIEQRPDVPAEVFHHDLHLLGDVVGVELHPAHQFLEGGIALHFFAGEALAFLGELEGELVGGVVLQHIEDELFLDRLAHRIHVEGRRQVAGTGRLSGVRPAAEQLQRLGLGRGGEGHVGDAAAAGAGGHVGGEQVVDRHLAAISQVGQFGGGEHLAQFEGGVAGLRAVGLIGDHREALAAGGGELLHFFDEGREGLDGADHDLLVARECCGQLLALDALLGGD